jgi:1,4-alpha-glucan branching enzyme
MFGQPAKKLLFMGDEFAQRSEWSHESSLEWHLLRYAPHTGMQRWVTDLNKLYREEPALHELDLHPSGFEWIECHDGENGVLAFLRRGRSGAPMLVACNFTPVPREGYRVGVPLEGYWRERLNSDGEIYGGCGLGNSGGVSTAAAPSHGQPWSLRLTIPPLGMVFLQGPERR